VLNGAQRAFPWQDQQPPNEMARTFVPMRTALAETNLLILMVGGTGLEPVTPAM
jgi:hypothetical protein